MKSVFFNLAMSALVGSGMALADGENIEMLQEQAFHVFQQTLRLGKPVTRDAFPVLFQKGAFAELAQALMDEKEGKTREVSVHLEAFLSAKSTRTSRYLDLALMMLARNEAIQGKRTAAAGRLRAISKQSNYFPEALADLGSLYLENSQPSEAADAFSNLQLGNLAKTFQPEAHIGFARALVQLCQYPGAYRTLKSYGKKYLGVSVALRELLKLKEGLLYQRMIASLEKEPAQAGETVVLLELVRQPRFFAIQSELNSLIAESEKARSLPAHESRRRELTALIETGARDRLVAMARSIQETRQKAEFLENDILRLAGAQIAENESGLPSKKIENRANRLNWGRVLASELEEHEVWDDEVGALRALARNACKK